MPSGSPIGEGFRTAFRNPAVVLAEIAWRWTFGAATLALMAASFFAYLSTLPVTKAEVLALHSHLQWLVADAIAHIARASIPVLLRITAILLPAVFVLWIAAASLGRAATLKALVPRGDGHSAPPLGFGQKPMRSMVALSFLRSSIALASLIGFFGALIVAAMAAARSGDAGAAVFLAIFAALAVIISVAGSRMNWFLSLATLFAIRDGADSFTALSSAAGLLRRRTATFLTAGAVFGTMRAVLFVLVAVVWALLLSVAGKLPTAASAGLLIATTLAYFAVDDFFCIARLATYVALDEHDRTPPPPASQFVPPTPELPPEVPAVSGPVFPIAGPAAS